jgi:autotransporter-associated beta strand protein
MKTKLLIIFSLIATVSAYAGSATWSFNGTGIWNTATNWTPNSVPNGPSDVATFETSTQRSVSFSAITEVNSIVFNPGAPAFTISNDPFHQVTISGAGIINNSGLTQQFLAANDGAFAPDQVESPAFPEWTFRNSATAGSQTVFTVTGGQSETGVGGNVDFYDSTSADHATFVVGGSSGEAYDTELGFYGSSTAANATIRLQRNSNLQVTGFQSSPTLGEAVITNTEGKIRLTNGGSAGQATISNAGHPQFLFISMEFIGTPTEMPTAANATITNEGGSASLGRGAAFFHANSTAGNAVIINNGGDGSRKEGGSLTFDGAGATAGNATLIANSGLNGARGGVIIFDLSSLGGTARLEIFGNGNLDISQHDAPGLTTGSLEGDGLVFLGARNLTLGSNNLSTVFSGVIADGGIEGGTGSSLTKIGSGTLTLNGPVTYTGGTTVNQGVLIIGNTNGSGTGSGPVTINAGTVGGSGTISGAVTAGGAGAFLAPAFGSNKQVTLTLQSSLTLQAGATYTYTFKARTNQARTDLVKANGVTISSATIALQGKTQGTLTPGTVLTVISNTGANPIVGTFSNLADGAIVTVNGNNLQPSYSGGDGNDLTLTVVP